MRLGLVTPIVSLNPRIHNEWEEQAGPAEVAAIAVRADELGWHHLTCSEHIAVPVSAETKRGARYYEPLSTLGFIAARTTRIRLATHVLVLGYHHPVELAKSYGTLDTLSGGRVILGVGVGSLEPEFSLLGKDFARRGAVGDEVLRELRATLGRREVDGMVVDPHAVQDRLPIWVGGRSGRSLRRALELGDGWVPFGLDHDGLAGLLAKVAIPEGFDLVLHPQPAWDPQHDPDRCRRELEAYTALGANALNLRLVHTSLGHCLEQLEATMELVRAETS